MVNRKISRNSNGANSKAARSRKSALAKRGAIRVSAAPALRKSKRTISRAGKLRAASSLSQGDQKGRIPEHHKSKTTAIVIITVVALLVLGSLLFFGKQFVGKAISTDVGILSANQAGIPSSGTLIAGGTYDFPVYAHLGQFDGYAFEFTLVLSPNLLYNGVQDVPEGIEILQESVTTEDGTQDIVNVVGAVLAENPETGELHTLKSLLGEGPIELLKVAVLGGAQVGDAKIDVTSFTILWNVDPTMDDAQNIIGQQNLVDAQFSLGECGVAPDCPHETSCVAGVCQSICDDPDDTYGGPIAEGGKASGAFLEVSSLSKKTIASGFDENGEPVTVQDSCYSEGEPIVVEAICADKFVVTTELHDCLQGQVCSDGACVEQVLCEDSDGGKDVYNEGTVVGYTGTSPGKNTKTDTCLSSTAIGEYSCGDDGFMAYDKILCPQGTECVEDEAGAACFVVVKGPVICEDTDGGIEPEMAGNVVGEVTKGEGKVTKKDTCLPSSKVREFYCGEDGLVAWETIECSAEKTCEENANGEGACVVPETCGNGVVEFPEQCDAGDGNDDGGEAGGCRTDCTLIECGDGVVDTNAGEQCDDGNTHDKDGCNSQCQITECDPAKIASSGTNTECKQLYADNEQPFCIDPGVCVECKTASWCGAQLGKDAACIDNKCVIALLGDLDGNVCVDISEVFDFITFYYESGDVSLSDVFLVIQNYYSEEKGCLSEGGKKER